MATKKQTRVPLSSFDDLDASGIGAGYTPYAMPVAETPAAAPPEGSGLIRRIAGDGILTAVKGAIGVPEAAVGLTDIATGGSVGKFLENEGGVVGFRPKQAKEYLDQFYSPEQKAAFAAVQGAANPEDGLGQRIVDTGMAALRNPSVVAHAVGESVPMIGAGGVLGRGVMAMAPKVSGFAAAGIGEGIMAAGSGAEQIRQQTADGYLTGTQSMLAAGSGMATGALGIIAGKAAKSLGIGDIDTLIVGGKHVDPALQKGFTRKLLEGAFTEGVLEELPQSVQEQVVQNYALGKSLDEGVDQAVVMGLLSGGAMGMGAQVLGGSPKVHEVGPMSRAANLAGAPVVPPAMPAPVTPPVVAPVVSAVQPPAAEAMPAPAPFDAAAAQAEYRAKTLALEAQEAERARLDAAAAPIPLEEASQEDQATYLQEPAADELSVDDLFPAPAPTVSSDILNTNGVPFKTLPGAMAAQKQAGDTHEIVPVANGFVVRAKEEPNGATATPAGLAKGADEPASNQPGGSGFAALVEPIDGQRGNVQGDAEPIASNGPADAVPLPGTGPAAVKPGEVDDMQEQANDVVLKNNRASVSLVQRMLRIGYNRAARLVENMEVAGLVSPMAKDGSRTVLKATAGDKPSSIGTSANLPPAPVAETPSEEGEQWTRMPQADRLALTTRTGMAKMVADKIARTPWADITPKTRARIVGAMAAPAAVAQPAQPGLSGEGAGVSQSMQVADALVTQEEPAEVSHNGARIYQSKIKVADDAEPAIRWAVESQENKALQAEGKRAIGGDSLHSTLAEAKKAADFEATKYKQDQERKTKFDAEAKANLEAAKAKKDANKGKSLSEIKAEQFLEQEIRNSADGSVTTRAEWVKNRLSNGEKASTRMVDKIKPLSRAAFNRANNQEQAAHDKKVKDGGKVSEYMIGDYVVTKTEYDYAQSLSDTAAPKAEPGANTIFTEDAAAAARARLKSKLGRLNSGLDPETMMDGITLAGYHIEKGARSFAAYAKAMVADLGDGVKPYLKSWYLGVRFDPRAAHFDGMDSAAVVESAELEAAEPEAEPEATENTAPDIVEHVTAKGKTLRGVVRTDLTQAQAKEIDKFTFKKDGGFFIREQYLGALNDDAPQESGAMDSDQPTLGTTEGRHAVAQLVADHLIGGNEFAGIVEARKFIGEKTGEGAPQPGTDAAKRADEAVELGVVMASREIVEAARKQGRSDEVIFNRLVGIYKAQPSLNVRDSVSLRNQAYSTPVPLAFVASRLAKVTPQKQVGEPTAGNGALMMEADPKNATVNEIQDDRLEALRSQGFEPSQNNAATMAFSPKTLDAMVMNPPFGPVNGQKWTFGDFTTGEIDHAIVMNSLQALKDNGDAVMIIGGTLAQDDGERKSAYRGKAKREFFFTLYGQYNVVDHFTVSGDLYKKQGAAFPVDVLVIRGRGKSQRGLPAAQLPQMIGTWDELREKLNETSSVGAQGAGDTGRSDGANGAQPEQPVVPGVAALPSGGNGQRSGPVGPAASVGPAGGSRVDGNAAGPAVANGAADRAGQRANDGAPAPTGDTRRIAPEGGNQQQGSADGNRPDQPAGVDAGSRDGIDKSAIADAADSGRLQVKYKNFSGNRSVNTLVATNHLSAIENAFTNLRARVGDIDAFVRAELQYEPEQFKKSFSAEQVEALALAIDNIGQGKGFIIGDQTGIGKGRVVAAMIRYAKLNGKVPVFVTQMPDLYGDMMRDLNDIGMSNTRPLMTNNNASVPLDAEALEWFGEKQGINTRITELLDAIEGVVIADLGESAAGLEPEVRAKRIAEGIKTSANPEIVSLRDEIKELKEAMPARRGKFLDTPSIDAHEKALQKMVNEGSLGDHDVIFTTYNQMAALDSGKPKKNKETGVKTPASAPVYGYRSTFLNSFVNANAMLILDESHNAGEAGDGKFPKVGDVVRKLIGQSGGVFYSSATFAKNTAVMDVYSKTDLGSAFDTPGALVEAINSVPMQQITSAMLVEAGQYLRRERSFDGIEYQTETVQVDQQAAEDVSTAMRLVVAFDKAKKSAIADMQDQLDQEGAVMSAVNGGGSAASVDSVNFTSVMHNVVNTFLLALKADAAANTAIAAIRAGEKPVITVANTMEMFITEFAKEAGLGIGDKLDATFADVLKRYLEKTRKASIKHANGNSEILVMTDAQLGSDAVDAYNEAYDFIDDMELDIPLSPIDHIKQKIEEAGFSIGEITGRQTVVTGGTLRNRNKAELNTAGKKNTIAKFNGGQIDALIINRSGSTGLSMHSSETFADQRRRLMIVAQAELDINNHMQMLGRTNRTGQVTENGKAPAGIAAMYGLPRYAQMTANVPIELRPAAVLSNKMAGLNANTTAGRKGSVQDQGALDFMNKYGDRVAAELVGGNSVLNERLGSPIKMDENGAPFVAGAIAKVTGRIGLLPLADQTDLYGQLATEYGELIAQLDALGQNDLEAKTYPLDAETLESKVVQKADARSKSPFTAAVTADKVNMRKLGKPYPKAKVLELVDAQLKGRDAMEVRRATLADVTAKINAEISALEDAKRAATPIESATIQKQVEVLNSAAVRIRQTLPALGVSMMLKTEAGNMYGVVTKIERSGKAKSAGSLSAWKVQIAVVDGARSMTLPLTQLYVGDGAGVPDNGIVMSLANQMTIPNVARTGFDTVSVLEAFDRGQTEARETRVIITGNILRGYGALRGRLLNYTDNKGGIKQGILMPADFDMNAVQARFTAALKTEQQAIDLLDKGGVVIDKGNSGETLRIQKAGGAYVISVAKTGLGKKLSKNAGDLNFVSSGNKMKVRVWDAAEVREFLKNTVKPEGISLIPSADSVRLMEEDAGPAFSRSTSDTTGQDKAQVTSIVSAIAERWGNAPKIVIADNMADPLIPQAVRDYDQTQKSQGATGEPEGFVYKGKVYLLADQLATPTDVMRVLFHESLGHVGLRGVFGDKLKPILQQLAGLRRADVSAKAEQYGLDMAVEADRLQAEEEVLAELAQTKPELGCVKRAISLIRSWLRTNVPGFGNMKLTDADIIAQFILPARRFIEGNGGPGGGRKAAEIGTSAKNAALSRGTSAKDQTETAAFNAWFGDSKVVDSQGKPLVMYHGTTADFHIFNPGLIFLSPDPAFGGEEAIPDDIKVLKLYVKAENPFDFENSNHVSRVAAKAAENSTADASQIAEAMTGPEGWIQIERPEVQAAIKALGFDGFYVEENGVKNLAVFNNTQVKSATGNNGDFDGTNPDIRFSRSLGESLTSSVNAVRDVKLPAGYQVADLFEGAGRLSYWHKSVGTMYNLAQRSPAFKKVFDSIQSFLNDVSFYAAESADLAPSILPKLDKIGDVFKSPLSAADTKALSGPVFAGTLTWGRDKAGKAVPMEEIEASLAQVPLDDRAHMLVKGKKLDPKVLKMWQGLQQDQYEAMVNGKFEREFMKAGVVFTPAELKQHFGMTDSQVGLYQELRLATDKSLDNLAISEMLNLAGQDAEPIRAQILESASVEDAGQDLRDYLVSLVALEPGRDAVLSATAAKVLDIAAHAADLKGRGYAPLSRFGTFTLEATLETGERYFSMFETDRERNKVTRLLAQEGATDIKTGTMSQESYKLLNGVSPETAAIFGEMLGLESQGSEAKDLAFQEFIKRGTSNRSAMKRLLKRKGIAGFSDDAGRVLAGFIYSNARRTSSNLHAKETTSAVNDIPKEQGELKDTAVKLQEYVSNPQEEAQAFRGLLFAQYLGGSVASAMVNATQPFTVTFPYLSQFGGVRKAAAQMAQAVKDAAKNTTTGDARLDAALKKAEEDGIVSPQEVHALQAQASGNAQLRSGDGTLAGDGLAKAQNAMSKVSLAWGKVFGIAEQFNRRITFIAAYRTAVEQGMGNPSKFAEKAVAETQFVYNKGNKPRWARGVAGSILFTFKQYSVNYLELVARMATAGEPGSAERKAGQKAAILAIAVLFMMAGADGLPFVEDVQDVIDGTMQRMGYNFSSKQQMKEFFATQMGKDMAGFMMNGLSGVPGAPIDVSGRLGMGNLLPGTGVFLKKTDYTRDLTELVGPAGDLVKRAGTAFGQATSGEVGAAMKTISPVAARNLAQGIDMQEKGMYLDSRGRKIIETTSGEALAKAVGFQPRNVKDVQEATMEVQRSKAQYNMATAEIRAKWAQAIFEGNEDLRQEARDDVATWNTNNPGQRIDVNMPAILARVREMRKGKAQRIADTAPKAIRAQVRQQLREELE